MVALFTGGRLSETAHIRLKEVTCEDGINFIHFRHDPVTGRMLKAGASGNKRIPIHSELVRLGFLERVAALRKAGATMLFPAIWRMTVKTPAEEVGRRWRRHLDAIGL